MSQELLGQPVAGRCVVRSDARGSWKAAVPFVPLVLAYAFILFGPWGYSDVEMVRAGFFGGGLLLAAVARTVTWYRCGDDSLWDDGRHLMWARGGRIVSCVAWQDVVSVSMSSGARFPAFFWGLWQRDASALPRVFIRARACPASTRHQFQRMGKKVWDGQFASLVLTNRRAVLQAQAELKQLCARYVPESLDGSAEPRTIAEVIAAQRAAVAERPADEPGTGAVGSQVT